MTRSITFSDSIAFPEIASAPAYVSSSSDEILELDVLYGSFHNPHNPHVQLRVYHGSAVATSLQDALTHSRPVRIDWTIGARSLSGWLRVRELRYENHLDGAVEVYVAADVVGVLDWFEAQPPAISTSGRRAIDLSINRITGGA